MAEGVIHMIFRIKELLRYKVHARDGVLGEVEDFYFDDFEWCLRYMVVSGGDEMDGRRLLISTAAVERPDPSTTELKINLSKETTKNSPEITLDRPITREEQIAIHSYYEWPLYWEASGLSAYPLVEMVTDMRKQEAENEGVHPLRSARQVLGLSIKARDGHLGSVEDFLVEDEKWNMYYLVIDTGSWLPGRQVIISPQWIENIRWEDSEVEVDLNQETIKNSPEYDPTTPLDSEYEARLSEYYGSRNPNRSDSENA